MIIAKTNRVVLTTEQIKQNADADKTEKLYNDMLNLLRCIAMTRKNGKVMFYGSGIEEANHLFSLMPQGGVQVVYNDILLRQLALSMVDGVEDVQLVADATGSPLPENMEIKIWKGASEVSATDLEGIRTADRVEVVPK